MYAIDVIILQNKTKTMIFLYLYHQGAHGIVTEPLDSQTIQSLVNLKPILYKTNWQSHISKRELIS